MSLFSKRVAFSYRSILFLYIFQRRASAVVVVARITVLSYSNSYDISLPVVFVVDIDDDNNDVAIRIYFTNRSKETPSNVPPRSVRFTSRSKLLISLRKRSAAS
jgi:hypothetical protein